MSTHIEFKEMIEPNIEKYEKLLEAFYYQKLLTIQYLHSGDNLIDGLIADLNNWYKKEKFKCQSAKK